MNEVEPEHIADILAESFDFYSPPRSLREVLVEVTAQLGPLLSPLAVVEQVEEHYEDYLSCLLNKQQVLRAKGLFAPYDIVADGDEIAGFSYPRAKDSTYMQSVRKVAPQIPAILEAVRSLSPLEFEQLCVRILGLLNARGMKMTKYSRDEGIDFLGWLDIHENFLLGEQPVPFRVGFSMLVLGQAKKYAPDHPVGVKEIRELVGAAAAFHHDQLAPWQSRLQLDSFKLMIPILPLLMSTGTFSKEARKLAHNCGVLTRDGAEIALFLGLEGIGVKDVPDLHPPRVRFDKEAFLQWLRERGLSSS
jgi:restriction endonuclease Mrr